MSLPQQLELQPEALAGWLRDNQRQVTQLLQSLEDGVLRTEHQSVLLASSPKSASSFLSDVLRGVMRDYRPVSFATVQNGHVLDHRLQLPRVLGHLLQGGKLFAGHHVLANPEARRIIAQCNLRLLVTTRSILDSLVSLRDHIERDTDSGVRPVDFPAMSCYLPYQPRRFSQLMLDGVEVDRMDLIIDFYAVWYFQYRISWQAVVDERPFPVHLIPYEQLVGNEVETVAQAILFLDEPVDRDLIEGVIQDSLRPGNPSLLNVGQVGRGREQLTAHQIDRVRAIGRCLAEADQVEAML